MVSSQRHSTASAPCATWGSMTSMPMHSMGVGGQPEAAEGGHGHDHGAASAAPGPGGWRCCPAGSWKVRSGRSQASWARRRWLPVATVAPGPRSASVAADQDVPGVAP